MPPKPLMPIADIPTTTLFDQAGIRKLIRQRHEMEQLTAITGLDVQARWITGYKDVRDDEFWVRGHIPGTPMLPGVLMCEAGAQLASVYSYEAGVALPDEFIAFAGMDQVRFRGIVRPGQRLWLVGSTEKNQRRRMNFMVQGIVDDQIVYEARILGLTMAVEAVAGS
ncbi:MAG TPA: beta-hydroxyacyl-ACP dehydratase [Planctomycetia bacterium]|jgi:3-hydroxyacyl-[acyl-carrier-protein] dehydratase|nr:beta-hydroxyacyl-ACP dehydratase [Planctomycetia bacterium]